MSLSLDDFAELLGKTDEARKEKLKDGLSSRVDQDNTVR